MKLFALLVSTISMVHAFPGMSGLMSDLHKRQSDSSNQLIGDLVGKPDNELSKTGTIIKKLLQGSAFPEDLSDAYDSVPDKNSDKCKADTCCIWKHIADDMKSKMVETGGKCNNLARQSIRMGFHDAATWSLSTGKDGGADGSLVLARECYDRPANTPMISGCDQMKAWFDTYKSFGVSMADLIQMAGKTQHGGAFISIVMLLMCINWMISLSSKRCHSHLPLRTASPLFRWPQRQPQAIAGWPSPVRD